MAISVMKITKNGQISIPADVRRRWGVDRVVVIDTPEGLVVRPYDPDAVRSLRGKYRGRMTMTSDEDRRQAREDQAADELSCRTRRSGS